MRTDINEPKAADIAYVRFQAPDLGEMKTFLQDFGFIVNEDTTPKGVAVLYSRGTDSAPFCHIVEQGEATFVGVGFRMESAKDLQALAKMEGASEVHVAETPGGGDRVRFTDPQGYQVDGIFGWEECQPLTPPQRVPVNSGENRARRGEPVRLEAGPANVKRIGHCVLFVDSFRDSERWYKDRFSFVTSDEMYVEDESNVVGAFMRCNRGDIPVDHHTLFALQAPGQRGVQHVAFEVNDWDDVMLGHDHLKTREYQHRWGIGKHVLGSQVFDYWLDPCGNNLEHFSDGDLFNVDHPPQLHPFDILKATQWGETP